MLVSIVDYSDSFFEQDKDTASYHVGGAVHRGKFVLLTHEQEEVCVFSPIQLSEFHANIVERYVSQKGVEGHYNSRQDKYFLHDESWRVLGGGHWEYNTSESKVTLFGKSLAYGGLMLEPLVNDLMKFEAFDGANIFCA